jgi:hypothetical protein
VQYRTYGDLIADVAIWESYWTTAMERVLRSTSLPRRVALDEIAEVFLLRLLRPFKNEYSRAYANARLRHGLMFLGMRILTQPDVITKAGAHTPSKTKLSVDRVTATLGWSQNGVIRCYRDLASMNVITYEKGGSFTPAAYGFPSRNRSAKRGYELSLKDRVFLARHEGTIAALIDGLPDTVADIIRCSSHPGVGTWDPRTGYCDGFNEVQLVVALADAARVAPESLGVSESVADAARARTVSLSVPTSEESIPEILDRIAEDPAFGRKRNKDGVQLSAREAQSLALEWYEDVRAENAATAKAKRAQNRIDALAGSYVWRLLEECPCPKRPDEHVGRDEYEDLQDRMYEWLNAMHDAVLADPPEHGIAPLVPLKLREKIVSFKLGPEYAAWAARFVFEAPAGAAQNDYLIYADEDGADDIEDRPVRSTAC